LLESTRWVALGNVLYLFVVIAAIFAACPFSIVILLV
jgi:hypothetical protein